MCHARGVAAVHPFQLCFQEFIARGLSAVLSHGGDAIDNTDVDQVSRTLQLKYCTGAILPASLLGAGACFGKGTSWRRGGTSAETYNET